MKPPSALVLLLCLNGSAWGEDPLSLAGDGVEVVETALPGDQTQVADRQAIDTAGATDVAEALERTLGVVVLRNGGYGNQASVELRGFGAARVAVLIDGIPANSAQTGGFDLGSLGVSGIERIEVSPGGGGPSSGLPGAVGGVINLVTVPPLASGWSLGASVSTLSPYPSALGSSLFDTQGAEVHGRVGGDSWTWAWDSGGHLAKNQFPFIDEDGVSRLWTG
ncbi:MAG TPA: TonB-dependent receptor plug domain-containing protein, partial [Spirochaetia bacterium]|nr:TonB-dependent receptor plug domain-containing protein [Spirochaetia bacterium]